MEFETRVTETPKRKTISEFLSMIDPVLLKYTADFNRLDFINEATMKFFRARDFDKFSVSERTVHKRMIFNAVAKLQTPQSHLGIERHGEEKSPFGAEAGNRQNTTTREKILPKKLFTSQYDVQEKQSNPDEDLFFDNYHYQTPQELSLQAMERDIGFIEVELDNAKTKLHNLDAKYVEPRRVPGQKKCTNCHSYGNHDKRSCPFDKCVTPEQ